MIERCEARGAIAVLISTPLWETYRKHMIPERYARLAQVSDSLARHYEILYFNFTEDARFVEEDFWDANHLRRQGAVKFSEMLNGSLQKFEGRLLVKR